MEHQMVSAVITTYKREPSMVCRAVSSIMAQTYQPIEIIVVDDSPETYPLREAVQQSVRELCPDVHYICHEKNRGACVARNTGLRAAKGEFIAYLDDDDEWLPEKISKQMGVMCSTNAKLVYCSCICQNDTTGIQHARKARFLRGDVFSELLKGNFIDSTSFPLIETAALRSIDGFDVQIQSAQDYDVWLRLAQQYSVDYVQEPLVIYHEHEGEQITSNPQKKIAGLERINEKYSQWINQDPGVWQIRHTAILPYYVRNGEMGKAIWEWGRCVSKQPAQIHLHTVNLIRIIKTYVQCFLSKKKTK